MECMTETLTRGYSSESAQGELSNEYQHDRVKMVFKNLCMFLLWTKVALALDGLNFFLFTFLFIVFSPSLSRGDGTLMFFYLLGSSDEAGRGGRLLTLTATRLFAIAGC